MASYTSCVTGPPKNQLCYIMSVNIRRFSIEFIINGIKEIIK